MIWGICRERGVYFHPLFIYIVMPYTKTAIIMFDIIFVLVFGRLQASGTLNFPDRLYPIWKWALGAGMLYAAIGTMLGYAFSGSFSLVSFLLIIVLSPAWFSLYFKLLRLTASKTVLNQCIYWVLGIVSALSFPFVVGYLSLLVKGFMQ